MWFIFHYKFILFLFWSGLNGIISALHKQLSVILIRSHLEHFDQALGGFFFFCPPLNLWALVSNISFFPLLRCCCWKIEEELMDKTVYVPYADIFYRKLSTQLCCIFALPRRKTFIYSQSSCRHFILNTAFNAYYMYALLLLLGQQQWRVDIFYTSIHHFTRHQKAIIFHHSLGRGQMLQFDAATVLFYYNKTLDEVRQIRN